MAEISYDTIIWFSAGKTVVDEEFGNKLLHKFLTKLLLSCYGAALDDWWIFDKQKFSPEFLHVLQI